MKKIITLVVLCFGLSACTTAPFQPAQGLVFSCVKAPLQLEYNNTDLGNKVGEASANSLFGLIAFGNASAQKAAKDGNIKVIKHVDYQFTNVLFGFFTQTTVYVYGD